MQRLKALTLTAALLGILAMAAYKGWLVYAAI